jgi:hypothetical protein
VKYAGNIMYSYENGKKRSVETILRREGGRIWENDGGNEIKVFCKHFCRSHNEPPYNNNMKRKII